MICSCNLGDCREVYDTASPGFVGRCTAPLLVDAGKLNVKP